MHLLAYKRFAADELLACLREQMEIVKEITPRSARIFPGP